MINTHSTKLSLKSFWFICALFTVVAVLEFSTPPDYVFGYLYIGPILLVNAYYSRRATLQVTAIACILTMIDIWVPSGVMVTSSTIASRVIAVLALIVSEFLSARNRSYQKVLLQQQAKLQAQEQLASIRENFASTLTHDLKTPLLGAIEALKLIEQGYLNPTAQKKVIATMIRSHQNSLQMVETLLDVYRNDAEGIKLNLAPVDLVEIGQDVAMGLVGLAASRRVHISFNCDNSEFRQFLWVNGDALQLHRVFVNLLTNAINHSPRGSKIEIVWEPSASYQVTKVIDSGAGITPEELPYLFERFYQGDSNRQAKGSGLGLYLTRQIIEAHKGTIWAENRYPHGAIFAFRLPNFPS